MGLFKAAGEAIKTAMHDQWKDIISCENMENNILMMRKTTDTGQISKKSLIRVLPGQCAVIIQNGKVLDATAEEGDYQFDESATPSFFAGNFGAVFKDMWQRFTFGGGTPNKQSVYFFNLKEIMDNKFGTATPIPYQDWSHPIPNQMTGGVSPLAVKVKCYGKYTFKISDPALFLREIAGTADVYKKDDIDFQDTSKCEVYEFSDYRFLTEAGAEVYNGKYFNNDNIFSYAYAIRIYDILSYIYGEDKMEDIFFSSDSVYELYKIMNVSLSTFNDFMKKVNVMIEEGIIDNVEVEDIINLIIKLYEDKYNKVWYQDKLLNYMIASFNPDIENKEYLMDVSEISKTIDVNGKDIIGNHVRVIDNNVYYTVMDFIGKDAYLYKIKIDLDKKEPISYDVKLVN